MKCRIVEQHYKDSNGNVSVWYLPQYKYWYNYKWQTWEVMIAPYATVDVIFQKLKDAEEFIQEKIEPRFEGVIYSAVVKEYNEK